MKTYQEFLIGKHKCIHSPTWIFDTAHCQNSDVHNRGIFNLEYSLTGWLLNPFASEAVYTRNFFSTACRTACKHAFCFLRVMPEAMSTRHSWLWQTLDDVYTRRCFSASEGTRFGAPGQKALPSGNEWMEWNEWMDFCLIPLSTTCSVEVPGTNL